MAAAETFQASAGDVTKTITVPNPEGLPRDQLAPLAAQAFQAFLQQNAPGASPSPAAPPAPEGPPDASYGSAFRSGVSSAVQGLGASMRQAGRALPGSVGQFLTDNADTVGNSVAAPKGNFVSPSHSASQALREGRYMDAARELPRLGAEALPQMAAVIGGGAVGSLAGPIGAAAGAGAVSLGMNAGRDIEDFARSNGEDPAKASGSSVAKGLALAVPKAALDVFGARGAGSLIDAVPTALGRAGARAAREGVTQAGMDVLDQGTKTGTVDPYQTAVAGAAGTAARALHETPRLAAQGTSAALGGATDYAMARWGVEAPKSPEEAASIQRVVAQVEQLRQTAKEGGDRTTDAKLLNNLRTDLDSAVGNIFRELRDKGFISSEQWRETFQPAFEKARRHTNSLLMDDPAFTRLEETGLPPEQIGQIKTLLTDLNTVADAHYAKTSSGPLEKAGKIAGAGASLAAGISTGSPYGIAGSLIGTAPGAVLGGKVGRMVDTALGLQKPDVLARARAADREFGRYDGQSLGDNVLGLKEQLNDRYSGLYDAYGFSPEAARAKAQADSAANTYDPGAVTDINTKNPAVRTAVMRDAELENAAKTRAAAQEAADAEKGRSNNEAAGRFLEQSLIKGAKKTIAGGRKSALESAQDAIAQLRETEKTAGAITQAEKIKRAQEDAAWKHNKALRAAEESAANTRETALGKAEKASSAQRTAEERAAWKVKPKEPPPGPDATATQIAGHAADQRATMAAQKAQLTALEKAQTLTERAADQVSGMAYKSPEARAARAEGIVGAAATTGKDALGNTRDPIPVNSPVRQRADGSYEKIGGDVPSRKRGRQGAAKEAPAMAPEAAPPAAQPDTYGARVDGNFSAGHMAYALKTANEHLALSGDKPVTRAELEAATRHIGENGTLADLTGDSATAKAFAEFLLTHQHPVKDHPMVPRLGQAIAAQVLGNRGLGDSLWQGTRGPKEALESALGARPGDAPSGPNVDAKGDPIRSRPAYDNAAKTYHEHMRSIAGDARDKGYTRLATVIDQIAKAPTALEKVTIRDRYEAELRRSRSPDAKAELKLASTLLSARGLAMKGSTPKRT